MGGAVGAVPIMTGRRLVETHSQLEPASHRDSSLLILCLNKLAAGGLALALAGWLWQGPIMQVPPMMRRVPIRGNGGYVRLRMGKTIPFHIMPFLPILMNTIGVCFRHPPSANRRKSIFYIDLRCGWLRISIDLIRRIGLPKWQCCVFASFDN